MLISGKFPTSRGSELFCIGAVRIGQKCPANSDVRFGKKGAGSRGLIPGSGRKILRQALSGKK